MNGDEKYVCMSAWYNCMYMCKDVMMIVCVWFSVMIIFVEVGMSGYYIHFWDLALSKDYNLESEVMEENYEVGIPNYPNADGVSQSLSVYDILHPSYPTFQPLIYQVCIISCFTPHWGCIGVIVMMESPLVDVVISWLQKMLDFQLGGSWVLMFRRLALNRLAWK